MQPVASTPLLHVARAELPPVSAGGCWPCGFCGHDYPVHRGWLVDYFHAPTRQARRSYVCADCAAQVRMAAEGEGAVG